MSQKPFMWNGNNPVQYSDPSGYAEIGVSANDVTITIFVHFTQGATGDTPKNETAFINNTERRLSGQVGNFTVHTDVVAVDSKGGYGGKGVIEVNLQDPAKTPGGNPQANGMANHANVSTDVTGTYPSSSYPDATAGSQAHELFHNLYWMGSWPGEHNPSNSPDLMNSGWGSGAGLSQADITAAEQCSCNTVVKENRY